MLALVIIIAMISVSIAITSYRYSVKKIEDTRRKMDRPDLIHVKRR